MPRDHRPLGDQHAIVIGGGLAGLLCARALRRHFQRVTVLDRDHLPSGPQARAGAPQGHHVHALIARGWRIMSELFPELSAALDEAGAPHLDWLADVAWHTPFGPAPRNSSPLRSRACTRALLEYTVRRLLLADPRVHLLDGVEVDGLQSAGDRDKRVTGVIAHRRGRAGAEAPALTPDQLRADLVLDASGRGSKAIDWLTALGYPSPPETLVDAKLGYASRLVRRAPNAPWAGLYVMGRSPHLPRAGVIYPVEGDRWIVTLVGYGGDHPPTDDAGFLAFARGLATPELADALAGAAPLTSIHGYRRTESRVRHFERLRRWPGGLLIVGDAACALNPAYGQGMTVSAIEAELLSQHLRLDRPADQHCRDLQRRLAAAARPAFLTASGDDFRWPTTSGRRPPGQGVMHKLIDRLLRAATRDPALYLRLLEVLQLVRPTSALLDPRVLAKIF